MEYKRLQALEPKLADLSVECTVTRMWKLAQRTVKCVVDKPTVRICSLFNMLSGKIPHRHDHESSLGMLVASSNATRRQHRMGIGSFEGIPFLLRTRKVAVSSK